MNTIPIKRRLNPGCYEEMFLNLDKIDLILFEYESSKKEKVFIVFSSNDQYYYLREDRKNQEFESINKAKLYLQSVYNISFDQGVIF